MMHDHGSVPMATISYHIHRYPSGTISAGLWQGPARLARRILPYLVILKVFFLRTLNLRICFSLVSTIWLYYTLSVQRSSAILSFRVPRIYFHQFFFFNSQVSDPYNIANCSTGRFRIELCYNIKQWS